MSIDPWPAEISHGVPNFDLIGGERSGGGFAGLPAAGGPSPSGPHWRCTIDRLPLHRPEQLAAGRALQSRLQGGAAPVLIPACVGGLSPQIPGGSAMTATLAADAAAGASSLQITFAGSHYPIRGGETFSASHADDAADLRMYRIAQPQGGGVYQILPPLRASLTAGAALDFLTPSCPMHLVDGWDLPVELGRFSSAEGTFEEWFDPPAVLLLRNLSLSPNTIVDGSPEDAFVGYLLGVTIGSTLTLEDDAGGRFKLVESGGSWSIVAGAVATDYDTATSHAITVRETLDGYDNSPHDNVLTIDVVLLVERHRAWRMFFATNAGNATRTAVTALEFAATVGGADQSPDGDPVSGGPGIESFGAAAAFDGNNATQWARNSTINTWLGIDFGADETGWKHVEQARIRGSYTDTANSPRVGRVDWTDEDPADLGATWTTEFEAVTFGTAWVKAAQRVVPFITPAAGEYWGWRLVIETVSGGDRTYIQELEIKTAGGVDQAPVNVSDDTTGRVFASSSLGSTTPVLLFDDRLDRSPWATFENVNAHCGLFFPEPVPCPVMSITCNNFEGGSAARSPHSVRCEGTYDNLTWTTVRNGIFGGWTLPETKSF